MYLQPSPVRRYRRRCQPEYFIVFADQIDGLTDRSQYCTTALTTENVESSFANTVNHGDAISCVYLHDYSLGAPPLLAAPLT